TAPVRRSRNLHSAETTLDFGDPRLERLAVGQGLRLQGSPRAYLAQSRPRGEIGVGLRRVEFADRAFDANLHLISEGLPVEAQRGLLMRRELRGLGAFVVAEEAQAVNLDALEQDDARGHPPRRVRGRQV